MSEYWKSNPRKYCDFCKCWIADNKPSVDFHERGKRHNENVQKRLEEIGKKGKEDHENKLREGDYMKEMEEAALRAYQKDIENNPDFMANKITELAKASNATIVVSSNSASKSKSSKEEKEKTTPPTPPKQPGKKWLEAKSPEGFSYYWNTETQETAWEIPEGGFTSLEEQRQEDEHKQKKKENKDKKSKQKKEKKCETSEHKDLVAQPVVYGPAPQYTPYGTWESANAIVEEVDLQLPALPEQEYYAPELNLKRPKVTFTEKIVTLSSEDKISKGPVSFQKRKGAEQHKKNARRRIDE